MIIIIKEKLNKFIACYCRFYFFLAMLYLLNKSIIVKKFGINLEAYIQIALLALMLASKGVVVNIIFEAKKNIKDNLLILTIITILLPFGEAYSAVRLRTKIDVPDDAPGTH